MVQATAENRLAIDVRRVLAGRCLRPYVLCAETNEKKKAKKEISTTFENSEGIKAIDSV